jgi:hypothetical protein
MRTVYLLLAIAGTLIPVLCFLEFFGSEGFSAYRFGQGIFANGAAAGFTADLFISSFAFWAYMFSRPQGPKPWLFIVMNLGIGLSLALPAYLYVTERRRAAAPGDDPVAVAEPG